MIELTSLRKPFYELNQLLVSVFGVNSAVMLAAERNQVIELVVRMVPIYVMDFDMLVCTTDFTPFSLVLNAE